MSVSALLAGQKALALMWPSAADLLGREHMFPHEVFDLLEDGPSFQRLAEQSAICSRCHRPGQTQQDTTGWLESPGKPPETETPAVLVEFSTARTSCACLG